MLIVICGLPATGKSTVAKELAGKINATVVRSDVVRKELLLQPSYSEMEKEEIYKAIFSRALFLLSTRENVILDATFYKKELREKAKIIAKETENKFYLIECICPERVLRERTVKRAAGRYDASDADFAIYLKVKREFEKIKEKHFVIDTSSKIEKQIKEFLKEAAGK